MSEAQENLAVIGTCVWTALVAQPQFNSEGDNTSFCAKEATVTVSLFYTCMSVQDQQCRTSRLMYSEPLTPWADTS